MDQRKQQLTQPLLDDVDAHLIRERNSDMNALTNDLLSLRYISLHHIFIFTILQAS